MAEKLVVVDDEKVILHLASMVLRNKGYEVFTAENGEEALELIAREHPALVLLDFMMPVMDGMTTLKHIVRDYPETYVVMFTGKGSEEIAVDLMKSGAADYVTKPFNNADLVERIQNVLRIRQIEMANRELIQERDRLLQEIESWNRELEKRVDEKTEALQRAQAEILQAEKLAALGHISAGMAHEIRNPLNSINLFAELLRSGIPQDQELLSYIDKICHEVERVDSLLRRLLTTTDQPRTNWQPVRLDQVIDRALASCQAQAENQGVTVIWTPPEEMPAILADTADLDLVFNNLFGNALYELQQGGTLQVKLWAEEERLWVDVTDSGGGIPEENLNRIFDPFFTTKAKGTGFGLSVVLRVMKAYGGQVSATSRPGEGTTFHLSFPLPTATSAATA